METQKEDILKISESQDLEIKKAKNHFPADCLETISAFGNTNGGTILLGLTENKPEGYIITGVDDPQTVTDEMFNALNDPNRINRNLITGENVKLFSYDDKKIIEIEVPAASYTEKPIYIDGKMEKAYKRVGPNDYRLSKEELEIMIRDSSPHSQDSNIIYDSAEKCLDDATISSYRNRFSSRSPEHIFNTLSQKDFLCKLSAAVFRDGVLYPTLAGLLMFGKTEEIKRHLPYYNLEYINYGNDFSERWVDRVIYDGTWGEGNLLNFVQIVIQKLFNTTNSKFSLSDDLVTRQDTTDIQIALRESFVNSLIHADYRIPDRIQVRYENNTYTFTNPGTLRISISDYYSGRKSSPRNPKITTMFRMIGVAEEAGSGVPKILNAAKKNQFARPELDTSQNKVSLSFTTIPILEILVKKYGLQENEIATLRAINKMGFAKRRDIESETGLSRALVLNALSLLQKYGIITQVGNSSATRYTISDEHISSKDKVIEALEKAITSIKNS